ncbi:MAG: polysaccharide deacetylase [Ruminococcaceae bacterium]|nr:polysaccharide deacetylase [Oscillospiraceae bacterium]
MNRKGKSKAFTVLLVVMVMAAALLAVIAVLNITDTNGLLDTLLFSNSYEPVFESIETEPMPSSTTTMTTTTTTTTATTTTTTTTAPSTIQTVLLPSATTTTAATQSEADKPLTAYLTFDDGPSDNTAQILDILDRYSVKGTFFVVYRKGYEDTYKAIAQRGHTIALHSWTHDYEKIYASEEAYFEDLDRIGTYVEGLVGYRPTFVRFPGGSSNTVSKKYCKGIMSTLAVSLEQKGYRYFDWNVSSGDASALHVKRSTIVNNVKRDIGKKRELTILMHDSPAKTTTVEALPEIIEHLQQQGFQLLPITDQTTPVHQTIAN